MDGEGLGAIDSATQGRGDTYFMRLFVMAFFISQAVLFLKQMQRGLTTNDLMELGNLSKHVMALYENNNSGPQNSLPQGQILLARNFPQVFSLVPQNWDYLTLEQDDKLWKRVVDPANIPPEFSKLCGLFANQGYDTPPKFMIRSLPQCDLPNLSTNSHNSFIKKLQEFLAELGHTVKPKTVVSVAGQESSLSGPKFIEYLQVLVKLVNAQQPGFVMEDYFEWQRDKERVTILEEMVCRAVNSWAKDLLENTSSLQTTNDLDHAMIAAVAAAAPLFGKFLEINISANPKQNLTTWNLQSQADLQTHVAQAVKHHYSEKLYRIQQEVGGVCQKIAAEQLALLFNSKISSKEELAQKTSQSLDSLEANVRKFMTNSNLQPSLCVQLATLQLRSIFWPDFNSAMEDEQFKALEKLLTDNNNGSEFKKICAVGQQKSNLTCENIVEILQKNLKHEELTDMGLDFSKLSAVENVELRSTHLQQLFARCEKLGSALFEHSKTQDLLGCVRSLNLPEDTSALARILETKVDSLKVKVLQERVQVKFGDALPPAEQVLVQWHHQVSKLMKNSQKEMNDCISGGYYRIIRPYLSALDVKAENGELSRQELEKYYADLLIARKDTLTWTNLQITEETEVLQTVQESFEKAVSKCPGAYYDPPLFKHFSFSLKNYRDLAERSLCETVFMDGMITFLVPEFLEEKEIPKNVETTQLWNRVLDNLRKKRSDEPRQQNVLSLPPWAIVQAVIEKQLKYSLHIGAVLERRGIPPQHKTCKDLNKVVDWLTTRIMTCFPDIALFDVISESQPFEDPDTWWVSSNTFKTKYFLRFHSAHPTSGKLLTFYTLHVENNPNCKPTDEEIANAITKEDKKVLCITPIRITFLAIKIEDEVDLWRKRITPRIFKLTGRAPWNIFPTRDQSVLAIAMTSVAEVVEIIKLEQQHHDFFTVDYTLWQCSSTKFTVDKKMTYEMIVQAVKQEVEVLHVIDCGSYTVVTTLYPLRQDFCVGDKKGEPVVLEATSELSPLPVCSTPTIIKEVDNQSGNRKIWAPHLLMPQNFTDFENCVCLLDEPWDATSWLEYFKKVESIVDTDKRWNNKALCGMRVLVGAFTKKTIIRKSYTYFDPKMLKEVKVDLTSQHPFILGQLTRHHFPSLPTRPPKYRETLVSVINMDCIVGTLEIQETEKLKTACLNMANAKHPGGGWLVGKLAQEEDLFYRTTLSAGLTDKNYPMYEFECSYVEGVCVLREGFSSGYQFLPPGNPLPRINILSAAAYDLKDGGFSNMHIAATRVKIETLLSAAVAHNIEVFS